MEYVEGRTLRDMIDERPLPLDVALDVAIQTGEALGKAHGAEVVHRDVKPDNILVDTDARVRVLDFGLAKLRGAVQLTREASTLGTVRYMSPEQASGDDVDRRTDVWSLGVVLYEMVAGRRPFEGDFENAVVYAITNEDPQPLTSLRSGVPLELERIVAKALAKKPSERYQGVDEMLVDLRAVRRSLETGSPAAAGPTAGPSMSTTARRDGRSRARRWLVVLVAATVVVAAVVTVTKLGPRLVPEPPDRRSIAVLPFHNLNPDPENAYFADGITEDITTQLSKIADLRVISRTSTVRYKDTEKPIREIGEELNVAVVLEGSVRRAGDRVRIVAQLIDTRTDEHLWAETYDRTLSDIFQIQSDVAQQIARALEATLTPEETARIQSEPTENLEAYETYLKGREYYNRYRNDDNEVAITLFQKAIEQDPNFALAYAGLADAYSQRVMRFGFTPDWNDSSLAAANRAIELAPDLAEGYKALGLALMLLGKNRQSLDASLRAVELNPNLSSAISRLASMYLYIGKFDETIYWCRRKMTLVVDDDAAGITLSLLAGAFHYLGMYERARDYYAQVLAKRPDDVFNRYWFGKLFQVTDRPDLVREQIAEIERFSPGHYWAHYLRADLAVETRDYRAAKNHVLAATQSLRTEPSMYSYFRPGTLAYLGYLLQKTGDADSSETVLSEAERLVRLEIEGGVDDWMPYYTLACIYTVRGDLEEALAMLRRSYELGNTEYYDYKKNPVFERLRGTEGFTRLLAEVRKNSDRMRQRVEDNDW
jgi:TolB-like protein